jgi:hypothetical protein
VRCSKYKEEERREEEQSRCELDQTSVQKSKVVSLGKKSGGCWREERMNGRNGGPRNHSLTKLVASRVGTMQAGREGVLARFGHPEAWFAGRWQAR